MFKAVTMTCPYRMLEQERGVWQITVSCVPNLFGVLEILTFLLNLKTGVTAECLVNDGSGIAVDVVEVDAKPECLRESIVGEVVAGSGMFCIFEIENC